MSPSRRRVAAGVARRAAPRRAVGQRRDSRRCGSASSPLPSPPLPAPRRRAAPITSTRGDDRIASELSHSSAVGRSAPSRRGRRGRLPVASRMRDVTHGRRRAALRAPCRSGSMSTPAMSAGTSSVMTMNHLERTRSRYSRLATTRISYPWPDIPVSTPVAPTRCRKIWCSDGCTSSNRSIFAPASIRRRSSACGSASGASSISKKRFESSTC